MRRGVAAGRRSALPPRQARSAAGPLWSRLAVASVASAALVAGLLPGSGSAMSVSSPSPVAAATRTVAFGGVEVTVPAAWPVVDLRKDPQACVRYDVHAVYLGGPGAEQRCPAHLVGRTDTVWLRPAAPRTGLVQARAAKVGALSAHVVDDHAAGIRRSLFDAVPVELDTTSSGDSSTADAVVASARLTSTTSGSATTITPGAEPTAYSTSATVVRPSSLFHASVSGSNVFTGAGIDTCTAPSTSTMDAWLASPYRMAGVYVGGSMMGCYQGNLSASWVQHVESSGWALLPIYVGEQAPCVSQTNLATIDPSKAAAEGAADAQDAVKNLGSYGFPVGAPVYYDMEAYDRTVAGCTQTVLTFLSAWTNTLHQLGYRADVYGSTGSLMVDLSAAVGTAGFTPPDDVWFAHYDDLQDLTDSASYPAFPDAYWAFHQRVHQYMGNINQTWGGATLNIDASWSDGHLAGTAVPVDYGTGVRGPGGNDFVFTGPMTYWRPESPAAGLKQLAFWTNTGTGAEVNGATWSPSLPLGEYRVSAYLPGTGATAVAPYTVTDRTGSHTVLLDQTGKSGYADLGTFLTSAGSSIKVHLGDNSSTAGAKESVDGMAFQLVATVPDAPSAITASAGDRQATVTWTAPSDGGSTISGYTVRPSCGAPAVQVPGGSTSATVTGLTNGTACSFTVVATNVVGDGRPSAASPAVVPEASGQVIAVAPARVLDTRSGTQANPRAAAVPAGSAITVAVAGVIGSPVPAGASAAQVNVTVTQPGAVGFVSVSPTIGSGSSTINFAAGQTVANAALASLAADGTVVVTNHSTSSVQVIIDVDGYVTAGTGNYQTVGPVRLVDTRSGTQTNPRATPLQPFEAVTVHVAGVSGSPIPAGAVAAALHVTVTSPTAVGYLSVAPSKSTSVSTLNFVTGQTVPNVAVSMLAADGTVTIYSHSPGTVQLVVDVLGYVTAGSGATLTPAAPARMVDTRAGTSANPGVGALRPGATATYRIAGVSGSPVPAGATGVVLNVTFTDATGTGYLVAGVQVPNGTSTLNVVPGATMANQVISNLGADGTISVANETTGNADVVIDVIGYLQ